MTIDLDAATRLADEAERVANRATPAPWTTEYGGCLNGTVLTFVRHEQDFPVAHCYGDRTGDPLFIAHARTSVPALASTVRGLVERVRELEAENKAHRTAVEIITAIGDDVGTVIGEFDGPEESTNA